MEIHAKFVIQPVAERDVEDGIYVAGTTNFPDGMKSEVVLGRKQAEQNIFIKGGRFRAAPLCPEAEESYLFRLLLI